MRVSRLLGVVVAHAIRSALSLGPSCPPAARPGANPRARHFHIAKAGGTTVRSIVVYRYRGRELHGAGKGTLADYARNCLDGSCPIVTWLREPASKVCSNFFYLRTLAARSNARWVRRARCETLGEHVSRAHAWHNHQYAQLIVGMPLGRCGIASDDGGNPTVGSNATNDGGAERRFEAPADLRRGAAIEAVCPAGADAFRERVREILDAQGMFVGVLELFDASLLAMQRELGYESV